MERPFLGSVPEWVINSGAFLTVAAVPLVTLRADRYLNTYSTESITFSRRARYSTCCPHYYRYNIVRTLENG